MRKFLRRCATWAWLATAGAVIATAVVISAARLVLPRIHEQRAVIEGAVTKVVGRPVRIGEIAARWRGWGLEITVTNLALLAENGRDELIRFDHSHIEVAALASLAARGLVPHNVTLSGVGLTIVRNPDGSFAVAGMPPSQWPVIEWLLAQRNFTVSGAAITFIDRLGQVPTVVLRDGAVSIRRTAGRRRITGTVALPVELGERLQFGLDVQGDLLAGDWRGDVHVEAHKATAAWLLERLGWRGPVIGGGSIEASTWSHWEQGQLVVARMRLKGAGLRLAGGDTALLERLAGTGHLHRVADGWALEVGGLDVAGAAGPWPTTTLRARWREPGPAGPAVIVVDADYLGLREIAPLVAGFGALAPATAARLRDAAPAGGVERVRAGVVTDPRGARQAYFSGEITGLRAGETTAVPGVSGLRAALEINAGAGVARFTDTDFTIHSAGMPAGAVEVQHLDGMLRWRRHADGWEIASRGLGAVIESVSLHARGRVDLAPQTSPLVELVGEIDGGDAARVPRLFPIAVLPPHGREWLDQAFAAGAIRAGRFVMRGRLGDFPFDRSTGEFQAEAEIEGVALQYARAWPPATGVDARLAVHNRVFTADIDAGRIFDAPIVQAQVRLPDLFTPERQVRISGTMHATPQTATAFVMQSPLQTSKAARIADLEMDGEIALDLDIHIPLHHREDTEVLGQVHFDGNRVHSTLANVTLEKLHGSVSFTRDDWYGEGLDAEYEGRRVGLVVNGGLDDPNYDSEFRMTGTADAPALIDYLRRYAAPLYAWLATPGAAPALRGEIPWKAVLTVPGPRADGQWVPRRLSLSSSLSGLEIALPAPLGKVATESRALQIDLSSSARELQRVEAAYGDIVRLDIAFDDDPGGTRRVASADVAIGVNETPQQPGPVLAVHGHLARLEANEWAALWPDAARAPPGGLPVRLDVRIDELDLLGQRVKDVSLTGGDEPAAWKVRIAGDHLAGDVEVPRAPGGSPAQLQFTRIWLAKPAGHKRKSSIDPGRLPAVNLRCDSFRYGDIDLGRATLVTEPRGDGLHIDALAFESERVAVTGSGDWVLQDDEHQSRFSLNVEGAALGSLLATFGYDAAAIEGGKTEIGIDARWHGMPAEFTLKDLNGILRLKVAEGRFLDIEPGGTGRLFGLLSMQTLRRRLSLDFSDLFKKGFAFDSIEGVFALDRGNAYTNSLSMNGPSAKIDVSGRTGLAEQDYDQRVVVTPTLSSSIPLASAFFGPAGVGVGAAIYLGQKMFKALPQQVDKFLSRHYTITGRWDKPLVERI